MSRSKYDLKKSHCPVCLAYGSTARLAGHVAQKHGDSAWPQWTELAADNWRLGTDQPSLPTATACAINDYNRCPPWWWAIQESGSIVASGTAQSEKEAKKKAWTQWLRTVGDRNAASQNRK